MSENTSRNLPPLPPTNTATPPANNAEELIAQNIVEEAKVSEQAHIQEQPLVAQNVTPTIVPEIPAAPPVPAAAPNPPIAPTTKTTSENHPTTIPEAETIIDSTPVITEPEHINYYLPTKTLGAAELEEEADENDRYEAFQTLSDKAKKSSKMLLDVILSDDSSEILLNGKDKVLQKISGQRYVIPGLTFDTIEEYHTVINTIILHDTNTKERIGHTNHLIEGLLEMFDPDDETRPPLHARVHVVAPPVGKEAIVTIAKKSRSSRTLEELARKGSMSAPMIGFIKALARGKANIVFSGVSGSGKTTMLEAVSKHFDENDRIILIEDTPELAFPQSDVVAMTSSPKKPETTAAEEVTLDWLVAQANRMRPDRIIVGECRGPEMAEFLLAANSGAEGSITTLHANNPREAIDKMLSLATKSANSKNEQSVLRDIAATVQIVIQLGLVDEKHVVLKIEEVTKTVLPNGIATSTIFEYDRTTGRHKAILRPSDDFTTYLAERGVSIDSSWFLNN